MACKSCKLICITVAVPKSISKVIEKTFGVSALPKASVDYFNNLCTGIIASRRQEALGHDFVQSLANQVVKISPKDPDTLVDDQGYLWTRKGM